MGWALHRLQGAGRPSLRCWNPYILPAGSKYHLHPCPAHPGRASALGPLSVCSQGDPDKIWPVAAASPSPTGSVPVKVQSKGELKGAGVGGAGGVTPEPIKEEETASKRPHSKTEAELQEEPHPPPQRRGEEDCLFSPAKGKCRHTGVRGRQLHFFLRESEADRTTSPMGSQK